MSSDARAGVLYKWVDKKGQIHITDYPPPEEVVAEEPETITSEKRPSETSPPEQQPVLPQIVEETGPESPSVTKKTPQKAPPVVIKEEKPSRRTQPAQQRPYPKLKQPAQMKNLVGAMIFGGSTIITTMIALMVFLYLYFALCLYLIGKRLGLSYAWLSWIPVLQIVVFVGAAGVPLWWLAILLSPMIFSFLGFLPFMDILSFIASIVAFVASVVLWMKISENLGRSRWLGLLILIPVINLIFIGILAFTSSGGSQIGVKRPVLITAGIFVLLVVSSAVVLQKYIIPAAVKSLQGQLKQQQVRIQQSMKSLSDTGKTTGFTPDREETISRVQFASLSASEYEDLLSKKSVSFKTPGSVSLGPVAVKVDKFWEDPSNPRVWLFVRAVEIPNIHLSKVRVVINSVKDINGREVYNRQSNFESEFFQKVNLQPIQSGQYLRAIRSVYLIGGAKEETLKEIQGKIILNLPVGIKSMVFRDVKKGMTRSANGFFIEVVDVAPSEVVLFYRGEFEKLLDVFAFNAQGQQIQPGGSSWTRTADGIQIKRLYRGNIRDIQIVLCEDFLEKTYPFRIKIR